MGGLRLFVGEASSAAIYGRSGAGATIAPGPDGRPAVIRDGYSIVDHFLDRWPAVSKGLRNGCVFASLVDGGLGAGRSGAPGHGCRHDGRGSWARRPFLAPGSSNMS